MLTPASRLPLVLASLQEGLVLPPYSFIAPTAPISVYKWDYSAAQANATAEKSFSTKRASSGMSAGGKAGIAVSPSSYPGFSRLRALAHLPLISPQILVILLAFGAFAAWKWGWPWYQSVAAQTFLTNE